MGLCTLGLILWITVRDAQLAKNKVQTIAKVESVQTNYNLRGRAQGLLVEYSFYHEGKLKKAHKILIQGQRLHYRKGFFFPFEYDSTQLDNNTFNPGKGLALKPKDLVAQGEEMNYTIVVAKTIEPDSLQEMMYLIHYKGREYGLKALLREHTVIRYDLRRHKKERKIKACPYYPDLNAFTEDHFTNSKYRYSESLPQWY